MSRRIVGLVVVPRERVGRGVRRRRRRRSKRSRSLLDDESSIERRRQRRPALAGERTSARTRAFVRPEERAGLAKVALHRRLRWLGRGLVCLFNAVSEGRKEGKAREAGRASSPRHLLPARRRRVRRKQKEEGRTWSAALLPLAVTWPLCPLLAGLLPAIASSRRGPAGLGVLGQEPCATWERGRRKRVHVQ